jgi:hypothetical protein
MVLGFKYLLEDFSDLENICPPYTKLIPWKNGPKFFIFVLKIQAHISIYRFEHVSKAMEIDPFYLPKITCFQFYCTKKTKTHNEFC